MKALKYVAVTFLLSSIVMVGQVNAQKVGTAANKQKQENLEKIKKRQADLKKKYNSLTPEQAAEARKKADEYKKSGGKAIPAATRDQPSTSVKNTAPSPAVKQAPKPVKHANVQKPVGSKKPVFMDANGKVKQAPSSTLPGKAETKPVGVSIKKTVVSAKPAAVPTPVAVPVEANDKKTAGVKPK